MAALAKVRVTPTEYLKLERKSPHKSELIDGEIIAMAGGSPAHDLISGNVYLQLRSRLKGRCRVFTSNMRVQVHPSGMYIYPDVSVVCSKVQVDQKYKDNLLNPTLIVEVLSESTAQIDRGRKTTLYRALPSLEEYLLIEQDRAEVVHYSRQADGAWSDATVYQDTATITLASVGCSLSLDEIYDEVDFNEV